MHEPGPSQADGLGEEFMVGHFPITVIIFGEDGQSLIVDLDVGVSASAVIVVVLDIGLKNRVREGHPRYFHE